MESTGRADNWGGRYLKNVIKCLVNYLLNSYVYNFVQGIPKIHKTIPVHDLAASPPTVWSLLFYPLNITGSKIG